MNGCGINIDAGSGVAVAGWRAGCVDGSIIFLDWCIRILSIAVGVDGGVDVVC